MLVEANAMSSRLFLVVGPLRTGSSLMARCLDDHPQAVCLCESEINQALFKNYYLHLHSQRMNAHGFSLEETIQFLDGKAQDDIGCYLRWFDEVGPRAADLYGKPGVKVLGDKSPDFFRSPELVAYLAANHRLIYTVRDPRAIFSSIHAQTEAPPEDKQMRWDYLIQNYLAWKPHLDNPNLLRVRYEDLVSNGEIVMASVYSHLGLPYSRRFLEPFPRPFPERFLWNTAIDWTTGIRKDFDPGRINSWRASLSPEQVRHVTSDPRIRDFMDRFGYHD